MPAVARPGITVRRQEHGAGERGVAGGAGRHREHIRSYVKPSDACTRRGSGGRTRDVLLQDIELLEDGVDEALRMLIDDEDLPSPGRLYGADRLQKLCRS